MKCWVGSISIGATGCCSLSSGSNWSSLLTPATYGVVGFLKRREGIDVFDSDTDFTPFRAGV